MNTFVSLIFSAVVIFFAIKTYPIQSIIVISALSLSIYLSIRSSNKAQIQFIEGLNSIIDQHIETLAIKRLQNIDIDDYGNHLFDQWEREIDYFLKAVVQKKLTIKETQKANAFNIIDKRVHEYIGKLKFQQKQDTLPPLEFEHYCAEMLRQNGWKSKTTKKSGDQGIDVVAIYGDAKCVLQCKLHSQPIGNSAVQEIIAGKQFARADFAVVVSNQTYTRSAKQLAASANVLLLHYLELDRLAQKLGLVP